MRVYCKCLNIEIAIYTTENKARPWKTIAAEAEDEDLPPSIDHESFQGDVFLLTAKTANEMVVRQDDIINRRKRIVEDEDNHVTVAVHAYLPHLIVTYRLVQWRVRECYLCRTTVMACLHRGLSVVCPAGLYGTSPEDGLHAAQNSGSARLWMFARDALSNPTAPLSSTVLQSMEARQHLESMAQVWRLAQTRAQAELDRRLEALRRQEMAAYEEEARVAKEMQLQVANAYYGLLSVLQDAPDAYVEAEEEERERKEEEEERRKKRREKEAIEETMANSMDNLRLEDMRTERFNPVLASGDAQLPPVRDEEVEVATEALDLYEADLFDDGPGLGRPSEVGDDDEASYTSEASAQEETEAGESKDPVDEEAEEKEEEEEIEASLDNLSTSAVSSSIQARVGMRANVRSRDDRLPDTDAFNAMTDAERTYAIEKASYQMQDNRLHEIYGDMEPPFLQELRRQAERARLNPAEPLPEEELPAGGGVGGGVSGSAS